MNVLQFLKDNNIEHNTEHHHCSIGWVMLRHCPFCNSDKFHLGIHLEGKGVNCWLCGGHSLVDTVVALLNCTKAQAFRMLEKYSDGKAAPLRKPRTVEKALKTCSFPSGTLDELTPRQRQYLIDRRFNPDKIVRQWNVKGTGHVGDYRFRIIMPITYNGIMVSYTGRDITGKSTLRYKTCNRENETRPHKHCLYGLDKIGDSKSAIVVEGITDVWRLGIGNAVATLGITWTMAQASLLLNMHEIFILYDSEDHAQKQAEKLASLLSTSVPHVEILNLKLLQGKDPADLEQSEADSLVKTLLNPETVYKRV